MKEDAKDLAHDASRKIEKGVDAAKDKAEDAAEKVKETAHDVKVEADHAVHDHHNKGIVEKTIDAVGGAIEKTGELIKEAYDYVTGHETHPHVHQHTDQTGATHTTAHAAGHTATVDAKDGEATLHVKKD